MYNFLLDTDVFLDIHLHAHTHTQIFLLEKKIRFPKHNIVIMFTGFVFWFFAQKTTLKLDGVTFWFALLPSRSICVLFLANSLFSDRNLGKKLNNILKSFDVLQNIDIFHLKRCSSYDFITFFQIWLLYYIYFVMST